MTRFILSRLFSALVVVFGVSCVVFMLIHFIPGDPVDVMLGETALPADKEALRQAMGLHLPLHVQLLEYFHGLIQFDFGTSILANASIVGASLTGVRVTTESMVSPLVVSTPPLAVPPSS